MTMPPKLHPGSVFVSGSTAVPIFGLSTWQSTQEETDVAINAAIDAGYRLIESSYGYSNESAVGYSLKKMFDSGKISRSEIFVTAQLPAIGNRPEDVELFLQRSLKSLKLDYVDMYLIGSPVGFIRKGESLTPRDENGALMLDPNTDLVKIWKAMEAQVVAGRIKSIGLAHVNIEQIQRIMDNCSIRPSCITLEVHVYCQSKETVAFCKRNGIVVTAFTPLGGPGIMTYLENWDHPAKRKYKSALKDPVILDIAMKYGKTPVQVILRYLLEYGVAVTIKTIKPNRIKDSFNIFDFELEDEDFKLMSSLDRGDDGRVCSATLFPEMAGHPEYPFEV